MQVRVSRKSQVKVLEDIVLRASSRLGEILREAVKIEADGGDASEVWARLREGVRRVLLLGRITGVAAVNVRAGERLPSVNPGVSVFQAVDVSGSLVQIGFEEAAEAFERLIPDIVDLINALAPQLDETADATIGGVRDDVRRRLDAVRRLDAARRRFEGEARTAAEIAAAVAPQPEAQIETIVRTATQRAFNEGSRDQLDRNRTLFPVYQLDEIRDLRTRGNPRGRDPDGGFHWQMDGFVAYSDDPIWRRIWPPNGWNCRATVTGLTVEQAASKGYVAADGSIDAEHRRRVEAAGRRQRAIVERGDYPDPGF